MSVLTPDISGLGSSLFARRYLGNRVFFLFLQVLRCFSSLGCLLTGYVFTSGSLDITPMGFSYSEIRVSLSACDSTRLFAAYRVLLRLLVPRHPPYALIRLTFSSSVFLQRTSTCNTANVLHMLFLFFVSSLARNFSFYSVGNCFTLLLFQKNFPLYIV